MGFPFFGETLQMVLQPGQARRGGRDYRWDRGEPEARSSPAPPHARLSTAFLSQRGKFLQMKRRKYGFIYKTHLFGRPTVRVMGADNVRRILLGEHRLVSVHWPASVRTILGSGCLSNLHDSSHKQRKKVIMQAFSREALQCYVPVITEEVGNCLEQWLSCGERGLLVYPQVKRLMFRIAMRILLGCESRLASGGDAEQQLVEAFEEMTRNLFSLPIDVPFSGLYRGMKARNLIHARIEENIRAKICGLRAAEAGAGYKDALQLLIEHSWERGERLDMQASGSFGRSTAEFGLEVFQLKQSSTELLFGGHETTASAATSLITYLGLYPHVLQKVREELKSKDLLCKTNQDNKLDIETLEQLKYIGCVIKETLRLNPPVPGGFRVALKTFELNGYQIPKGWNVIYSICDTHDVADIFTNKEEFNPDRFMLPHPDDASRTEHALRRVSEKKEMRAPCKEKLEPFGDGTATCERASSLSLGASEQERGN
ncbi:Cytochrome P450 26A1 [Myotis davidii]|uniref:Cytochrome P450 26A1 n=1 Tax=Myotis davidii TaxID=225400 RepID=L5ME51_MYODS|nr:Cytochrome P450 26A1 [Myotis davidii]